ncbi:MAG: right-handed parallel beta-helix repeat-containing protein [Thermodesulfobacteriota bacterium]
MPQTVTSKKSYPLLFSALTFLAVLLVWAGPVQAGKYYCQPGPGTGGSGTETDPWVTLHHAFTQLNGPLSEERVLLIVKPGTYDLASEGASTALSLERGNAIIVGQAGAEIVGGGGWNTGFNLNGLSFVNIHNLKIRNFSYCGMFISSCSDTYITRNLFDGNQDAIKVYYTGSVTLENNIILNSGTYAIYKDMGATVSIRHNTIHGSTSAILITGGASVDVRYNILTGYTGYGINNLSGTVAASYNNVYSPGATGGYYNNCTSNFDVHEAPAYDSEYRPTNAPAWLDLIPTNVGDDTLHDHVNNDRPQGSGFDMGAYENALLTTSSRTFPPGGSAADYQIASVPLQPSNPSASAVLGPQIGTYDPRQMRIGRWDGDIAAYDEWPFDDDHISPGNSAWFLFRNGQTLTFQGYPSPKTRNPAGDPSYGVEIGQGWNLLGNPFLFTIDIALIRVEDFETGDHELLTTASPTITQGYFWVYTAGVYQALTGGNLPVAAGGWVKKLTPGMGMVYFTLPTAADLARDHVSAQVVVDVAEAVERPPAPPQTSDAGSGSFSGGGGGGGGGGCFISSALDNGAF